MQPTDDSAWLEKSEASTAWKGATLHLHYARSLQESHPEVAALFDAFEIDGESLSAMAYALSVENEEPAEFAARWVAENEDMVLDWLAR